MISNTRCGWYVAALAIGCWLLARADARHRADPARQADEVLLRQLGRDMAQARSLSAQAGEHGGNDELQAAAERWREALAPAGGWHPFVRNRNATADGQWQLPSQADGEAFDASAAQRMQEWLCLAREHAQGLLGSTRPRLCRQAADAIAIIDASACDLDLCQCAEALADASPSMRRWPLATGTFPY
ncbi:exported hypothetical protein [uncultured Stenotrophomonas sp.]|uniref:Uncharacterized protein n=1 Tax=uncultured Stenotrophomonas sp. TaxID=165438 RepID=A0A1Y5Q5M7_9GAMM|nr:exported hypothetical protein [uncultured Stenotrophomonas sp.]